MGTVPRAPRAQQSITELKRGWGQSLMFIGRRGDGAGAFRRPGCVGAGTARRRHRGGGGHRASRPGDHRAGIGHLAEAHPRRHSTPSAPNGWPTSTPPSAGPRREYPGASSSTCRWWPPPTWPPPPTVPTAAGPNAQWTGRAFLTCCNRQSSPLQRACKW